MHHSRFDCGLGACVSRTFVTLCSSVYECKVVRSEDAHPNWKRQGADYSIPTSSSSSEVVVPQDEGDFDSLSGFTAINFPNSHKMVAT